MLPATRHAHSGRVFGQDRLRRHGCGGRPGPESTGMDCTGGLSATHGWRFEWCRTKPFR